MGNNGSYVPLSAKPNGNEAWVLLLEKAFAKFASSYAALEGGHQVCAFKALAGDAQMGVDCYLTSTSASVGLLLLLNHGRCTCDLTGFFHRSAPVNLSILPAQPQLVPRQGHHGV